MSDPLDPRGIEAQDPSLAMPARLSELDRRVSALERRLAGAPWHLVGAGGEPAFANSWVNHTGSGYPPARFYIDALGVVHLDGAVKSGTAAATAFTLPAGYRPDTKIIRRAHGWNGSAVVTSVVTIDTDGTVKPNTTDATNVEVWLTCSFRAAR